MKKINILILLLLIGQSLFAESIKIGELYYNLDDETLTAEVTYEKFFNNNYENLEGEITIPEELDYNNNTYKVTSIGEAAFADCEVTYINMPESIQTIGEYAFIQCFNLRSVYLPPSITEIGFFAFDSCKSLEAVYINDLEAWCKINFSYANANPLIYAHRLIVNGDEITEIDFPAGLQEVKTAAFIGGNFTKIRLSSDVISIGAYAFENCLDLMDIELPPSLREIGEWSFAYCNSLREIIIPDAVETIGQRAFLNCINLENVTLPNNITELRPLTLHGCKRLAAISIPPKVYKIDQSALGNCESLQKISVPESVIEIGGWAFTACYNLKSIELGSSISKIERNAFYECYGLEDVYIKDLEKWCLISFENENSTPLLYSGHLYLNGEEVTDLKIPESISRINPYAFYGCTNLATISFPIGIKTIGMYSFEECPNLNAIYCEFRPMSCSENIFPFSIYDTATLVVPEGWWGDEYLEISPWNKFQNITYYPYAGLDETINEKDNLYTVYSLDGKLIYENADKESLSHLQPGIYIINGKKVKL